MSGRVIQYDERTGFPLFLPDELRFTRFLSVRLIGRPPGDKLCVWCWSPVRSPRRSWCSQECVEAYTVRSSAQIVSNRLFKRDKGVCAICHQDSVAVMRAKSEITPRGRLVRRYMDPWQGSPWQADHIVPVVEGGGCCGLINYRTLCTACHLAETALLRKRIASARAPQKQILLEGMGD